ncbi:MAG: hypothetical protein GAK28_02930 [Luteibacter sp.]|uniref:hypothetical protein n=1 Tax=Luteibacter sp. TaxID=1886636 RepID=UPI0013824F6E|nr:hypothetical protein [Luteibacter sp.]KAF1006022.1 MAG: hypothetical protein GAK28_02930 [Luteibacter sp.]
MADTSRKVSSSLRTVVDRAANGMASRVEWDRLVRAGLAALLTGGRYVLTLKAIDDLSAWRRQHRASGIEYKHAPKGPQP